MVSLFERLESIVKKVETSAGAGKQCGRKGKLLVTSILLSVHIVFISLLCQSH